MTGAPALLSELQAQCGDLDRTFVDLNRSLGSSLLAYASFSDQIHTLSGGINAQLTGLGSSTRSRNSDREGKERAEQVLREELPAAGKGVRVLAEKARISLTPHEVEEFAPKIGQIIDWFGQTVDLESVEPSIRADTEGDSFRDDIPETFENREAMIADVPNYEEPYIKVPKVLNKE